MEYAFISYSSLDMDIADKVRNSLNEKGLVTWMAPYNIPAGSEYAETISRALKECSCFVLVLTENSQNSKWVRKEIERAINYSKPVIPLKIGGFILNDALEFYVSSSQIVVADKDSDINSATEEIIKTVRVCLSGDNKHFINNTKPDKESVSFYNPNNVKDNKAGTSNSEKFVYKIPGIIRGKKLISTFSALYYLFVLFLYVTSFPLTKDKFFGDIVPMTFLFLIPYFLMWNVGDWTGKIGFGKEKSKIANLIIKVAASFVSMIISLIFIVSFPDTNV